MTSAKNVLLDATPHAERLFERLMHTPFAAIEALPETSTQQLGGYHRLVSLTTYRSARSDGEVQVVVQLMVAGALGTARFWVEGFRLAAGGEPVRLSSEDLYDFH